jgi:hypothetical protein
VGILYYWVASRVKSQPIPIVEKKKNFSVLNPPILIVEKF